MIEFRRFLAGTPHDKGKIPVELVGYVMYAERWGWTPSQVDQLTLEQEDWFMPMAMAIDDEKSYREKKAADAAERKARAKRNRG